MMKIIKYFFLLIILASCHESYLDDERKFIEWSEESAPLNKEELFLIENLSKKGFKTTIERHYIERASEDYYINLECDTLLVTRENYRQLNKLKDSIIFELFNNIISDSVLFATKTIHFNFELQKYVRDGQYLNPYNSGLSNHEFSRIDSYFIKDLEWQNGFKVVRTKNNNYKRMAIDK